MTDPSTNPLEATTPAPSGEGWPALRVDSWTETRETVHRWMQVLGKIQLVSTPLVNHWWNVAFDPSARGFRSRLMHDGDRPFDAEFDFVDHELVIRRIHSGETSTVKLAPKSVAQFYREVQEAMGSLDLACNIVPTPNEIDPAIPFADDTEHKSYDADAANTFWRQCLSAARVFEAWRAGFAGKDSPVQLYWGSLDLSVVRYSGRVAPAGPPSHIPNLPRWVMAESENRENASAGFWAGGGEEGAFYAYTYPVPDGYTDGKVSAGTYDADLGEWILPYEQVRTSDDPDAMVLTFLDETYALAADLAKWDRAVLDVNPHRLDAEIYRGVDRTPLD